MSAKRMSTAARTATIAGAVLLLALLICEFSGWWFLRGPLARAISDATGTPVIIEAPFRAQLLWNPGIRAGRLRVAAPQDVDVPHLLDANHVDVRWGWLDVWRWQQGGPLVLRALGAQQLDARLVRPDETHASWMIGPQGEAKAANTTARPAFRIGALRVGEGVVKVDDAVNELTLDANLSLGEGAVDEAERGLSVDADGRWRSRPLKVQLEADSVMPLFDRDGGDEAEPIALQIDAELGAAHARFDGTVASLFDARKLDGKVQVGGPSLHAVGELFDAAFPHTPDFDVTSRVAHEGGVWRIDIANARFGDSNLAGELRYDSTASPVRLDGTVRGKRLTLTDFGPVIGTDTPPAASDRVIPDRPLDLPALQDFDADVQLDIESFDLGTPALEPMHALRGQIIVEKGALQVRSLHAQAVGGRFTGDLEIDSTAQPARWHASLRMAEFDVGKWLRVDDAEGSSSPQYLTGELQAAVRVTGYGRSTKDVLGSLDGQVEARMRDGTVSHLVVEAAGLDLAQALGVAISGGDALPLNCARLQAPVEKGAIDPLAAVIDNRDSTIRVGGRISLAEEELALRVEAKPKDFSLASLRSPVLVGGTFKNPQVGIEGSDVAPQLIAAAALAVVAPIAAWVPLIDLGEGEQSAPCRLDTDAGARENGEKQDRNTEDAGADTGAKASGENARNAQGDGDPGVSRAFTRERRYSP